MKKTLALVLSAAALTAALAGCGGTAPGAASNPGSASKGEVNVYNWGEYIDESIFEDFEAQTGIKVNYQTYPDNESMYLSLIHI